MPGSRFGHSGSDRVTPPFRFVVGRGEGWDLPFRLVSFLGWCCHLVASVPLLTQHKCCFDPWTGSPRPAGQVLSLGQGHHGRPVECFQPDRVTSAGRLSAASPDRVTLAGRLSAATWTGSPWPVVCRRPDVTDLGPGVVATWHQAGKGCHRWGRTGSRGLAGRPTLDTSAPVEPTSVIS